MGIISVKGLTVFAYHGVNPEERENGQYFILDIEATADLRTACRSDRLEDTVSYAKIIKTARTVFLAQKDLLIERAAQRVADGLLNEYSSLDEVRVRIKKPDAPIKAEFDYVAVEIEVKRSYTSP